MTVLLRVAAFAVTLALPAAAWAGCADVGLVLAIDASGSISGLEFETQRQGNVTALTAQPVTLAFAEAGVVDVAAVFWGDSSYAPQVVPWQRIEDAGDLRSFSAALLSAPRHVSGDTHMGHGLAAALALFDEPGRCADRRLIDLSGDGRSTFETGRKPVISLAAARDLAERAGVTINALAITSEDADLPEWYETNLIVGPFAFVLHVDGLETFGEAMTRKLMRELMSGEPVLSAPTHRPI